MQENWTDKISNNAQLGGIETSVLDNGVGRGTRIAWINTGSGFRFKVVIDRAMDIADAFYGKHSLAWLSNLGISPPERFSDSGTNWLRTFGGGLLTTCGFTHVGGPETDANGERGLHDKISNIPAEIESISQPDPLSGKMGMSITGRIKQTQPFGSNLELRRTISATIGKPLIKIHDEITNRGNTPAPHMLLYHFNFGWPLVDEGTEILWQGEWKSKDGDINNRIFSKANDFRKCPAPMVEHAGCGEDVAFINVTADDLGFYRCGLYNQKIELALKLTCQKSQLPWLTNWQHWGKGEYVTGLEPGTNPPIGQARARELGELIYLEPGERKTYDLEIEILSEEAEINNFLKTIAK